MAFVADTVIKTFGEPVASFIGETLGEPTKNAIGVAVSDPLAIYRQRRLLERIQICMRELNARGITNVRPIPPKLAIGIFQGASLEDEPELQEMWETLIANALDPNFHEPINPSFVAILKELSAIEALLLKCLVSRVMQLDDPSFPRLDGRGGSHLRRPGADVRRPPDSCTPASSEDACDYRTLQ